MAVVALRVVQQAVVRAQDITLTQAGQDYARAIKDVIAELNHEVSKRTDPAQLAAADAVLRAVLFDESARQRASRLPRPSPGTSGLGRYPLPVAHCKFTMGAR